MQPVDQQQAPSAPSASSTERRLSFLILGLLVIIAAAIVHVQSGYDASQWQERVREKAPAQDAAPAGGQTAVAGLAPMSASESYDAGTLSDKINGKAEFYLAAGFQKLVTRRFSLVADPGVWLERYVYDMGGQRNAFAVYSTQRRRSAAPLGFVAHGFQSSNGLFFIHGPYYVEIIAAEVSDAVQDKMKALASQFVKNHDLAASQLTELALFPPQHLVPGTMVLIADSAFGLADLDWVFAATYQDGEKQATAFLLRCESTDQARSLADAFTAFWAEFDGQAVALPDDLPEAKAMTILDNFEIAATQGIYLVGVHEASHLQFGIDVTTRLQQRVKDKAP